MARGKVQLKRIESTNSRHATFSKRRNGLVKKAKELSILCDAEVAVIIFSQSGRLYEFASSDMQATLGRYYGENQQFTNQIAMEQYIKGIICIHCGVTFRLVDRDLTLDISVFAQMLKNKAQEMSRQIEILQQSQRKFLGQCLGSYSLEELEQIDSQLDRSLGTIRARKDQLFKEQIKQLKAKEVSLIETNVRLREESRQKDGVEGHCLATELSIGLPSNG